MRVVLPINVARHYGTRLSLEADGQGLAMTHSDIAVRRGAYLFIAVPSQPRVVCWSPERKTEAKNGFNCMSSGSKPRASAPCVARRRGRAKPEFALAECSRRRTGVMLFAMRAVERILICPLFCLVGLIIPPVWQAGSSNSRAGADRAWG